MKNQKSVIAALFLIVGLSSCKKESNDLILSRPSPELTQRQVQGTPPFSVQKCYPTLIRDGIGNIEQRFTYDSEMKLTSLFITGTELITFNYIQNRLVRIDHLDIDEAGALTGTTAGTPVLSESTNNLKFYDIIQYFDEGERISQPRIIKRFAGVNNALISTFSISYDSEGRKVSETEFAQGTDKEPSKTKFIYSRNAAGNVTAVTVFRNNVLQSSMLMNIYDSRKNMFANVAAFEIMPAYFKSVNNPVLIFNNSPANTSAAENSLNPLCAVSSASSARMLPVCGEEIYKQYAYNMQGYPVAVTTTTGDSRYLQKIEYVSTLK